MRKNEEAFYGGGEMIAYCLVLKCVYFSVNSF